MPQPGRNEPCPCGSGRKYKFCHGSLVAAATGPASATARAAVAAAVERACGPCTACCEGWAEGEIRGHRMSPGTPCRFLANRRERAPGSSPCTIYDERPESPCRRFVCGWRAPASPFPEGFRPDLCGVVLVATRWRDRAAWILLPAGRDASDQMLAWMRRHAQATGEPFFYSRGAERLGYGPAAFTQEMVARVQRGEKLW